MFYALIESWDVVLQAADSDGRVVQALVDAQLGFPRASVASLAQVDFGGMGSSVATIAHGDAPALVARQGAALEARA